VPGNLRDLLDHYLDKRLGLRVLSNPGFGEVVEQVVINGTGGDHGAQGFEDSPLGVICF
jgi:hypothetical protein